MMGIRTAFALNQTLKSLGNILKLTFSVQHLTFVNLLLTDFTQRWLCNAPMPAVALPATSLLVELTAAGASVLSSSNTPSTTPGVRLRNTVQVRVVSIGQRWRFRRHLYLWNWLRLVRQCCHRQIHRYRMIRATDDSRTRWFAQLLFFGTWFAQCLRTMDDSRTRWFAQIVIYYNFITEFITDPAYICDPVLLLTFVAPAWNGVTQESQFNSSVRRNTLCIKYKNLAERK